MEEVESRTLLSAAPLMFVNNPIIHDTPGDRAPATFTVHLTSPSNQVVFAQYHTVDQTATAGKDYIASSGYVVFAPGQTSTTVTATLLGGGAPGSVATFGMAFDNPYNATIITPKAVGTISYLDTTAPPALTVSDVTMNRGFSGTSKTMAFTISLNTAQSYPVTVTASTANVNAIAGVDYDAKSEVLTFQPGQTTAQFDVTIHGTSTVTPTKLFMVNLSNTSAALSKPSSAGFLNYGA